MNRRIVLVAVFLLSILSSLLAQTIPQLPLNPFLVYGPKKYERSTGAPQTITNQFTLPPAASSPYTLYVANGWLDGSKRVTSAVIKINGATVVGQNDFKKNLPVIIKTINLNTNNQISITLNGQPGTFITLAITATDKNPPTITITNPKDSLVTRQSSITCTGIVTDETFATLTINGTIVLLGPGGIFSKTVQIAEGTNTITFVARDLWGNTASVTRTVTKDTRPPALTVASPVDGQIISSASVQVSGTVTDASTVIVTANGIPLTVNSNGSFVGEIPVGANVDTIRVTAIDGAQNQTTVTRIVRRASSPPVLTVTNPADSSLTKENSITVQGTVKDSGSVVLTINGSTIPVLPDGSFSAVVTLTEGMNQITVIATNNFGQSATATRTIRKDSTPPILTIISPIESFITRDTVLLVQGTAFDSTAISLKVNGENVVVAPDGSFQTPIQLVEGVDSVTIVARDSAGNTSTVVRLVRRDTTPPVLTILNPADSLLTRESLVIVNGTVFDSISVSLTVNGKIISLNPDRSFSDTLQIIEGINTITVVATDTVGNSTTATRTLWRDSTPPVLSIAAPIDSLITTDSLVTIRGTIFDSTAVRITVNGDSAAVIADSSWSKEIHLLEGRLFISVVAIDAANNQTTVTRLITRDTQPPTIEISSPSEGLITRQTQIDVTALIQDSTALTIKINEMQVFRDPAGVVDTMVTISEGVDTIIVAAIDAAGNRSESRRIVVCDTLPPVLTITVPKDSIVIRDSTITLTGTVSDSTGIRVTVNGDSISVGSDSTFSKSVHVNVGANLYTITATDQAGNVTTATRCVTRDTSSAILTYNELVDSLTAASTGRSDPFSIISFICEKKEGAISALDELLSEDMISDSGDTLRGEEQDTLHLRLPNSLLAVQAVELIGTPSACEILLQVAQFHVYTETRGMALNALSSTYYQTVCNDADSGSGYEPDVNIIRVLLKALDDSTKIIGLEKTIGEITREGFKNWTGIDTGEPGDSTSIITDPNTGETMTVAQYRERWWSEVGIHMTWNPILMQFQTQ